MRIALEVDYTGAGIRGGTYYLNHLMEQLSRIDGEDDYLLFGYFFNDYDRKIQQIRRPASPRFVNRVKRWPQSLVNRMEWGWKLPVIESYLALQGVDVYHASRAPSRRGGNVALTTPDIIPIVRPHWTNAPWRKNWEEIVRPGILRAKRIITYCKATQQDIVREMGVPEDRIKITRLGVDHELFLPLERGGALEQARARLGLPPRFLLMVGPFDVLANFKGVIEAVALWKKAGGDVPTVVAVGPVDDYVQGLQKLALEAGVASYFHWTGYLFHPDLVYVYNLASALVYPSLLPGVELPPYEAMACGTPVITSLSENIADAGLLVDAQSPADLQANMRKICESSSLREDLKRRGVARAAEFTWERTARETLAVYREVAGS